VPADPVNLGSARAYIAGFLDTLLSIFRHPLSACPSRILFGLSPTLSVELWDGGTTPVTYPPRPSIPSPFSFFFLNSAIFFDITYHH
jgi:hypothetical protein